MDSNIALALIVAVPAMVSPLLLSWLTNRNRRLEKEQDYARLDMVAKKAADAADLVASKAELVAKKAEEAARLLAETNKQVNTTAQVVVKKLDAIHGLVNGETTSIMQNELDSRELALSLMREIVELKKAAGQQPTTATLAAIESATARTIELKALLNERVEQQKTFAKMINEPSIQIG